MRRLTAALFGPGREGRTLKVLKLKASRAVYHNADIQRVEVEVEVESGDGPQKIILDMSTKQAGMLVRDVTNAYDAIHPPLRPRLGGTWE